MFGTRMTATWLPIFFALTATACVSTYGHDFSPSPGIPDQYTFKIYVSAISEAATGTQQSDELAHKEMHRFAQERGYENFEVIDRTKTLFPASYFEYTVVFKPPRTP